MRPNGPALVGTVLAEESHTPELLRLFRERLVAPRRRMQKAILERAKKRNELRPGVNPDCVVNILVGAFYARYLATSRIPATLPREIVEVVWNGISRVKSRVGDHQ